MRMFEINKKRMGNMVLRIGDDNKEIINLVPSVPPLYEKLRAALGMIDAKQGTLVTDRKGVTESKTITKGELIDDAIEHYGQLYLYADETGDAELRKFAALTAHELMHEVEENIAPRLELMLDKFDLVNKAPVKPELAKYDLSLEVKAEFAAEINLYKSKLSEVGTGRTDKSSARTSLTDLFKEFDHIMILLDKAMLKFKKTNAELYQKYVAARVIIDRGGGHGTVEPPPENPPKQ